jgi:hypothetical protein
LFSLVEVFTLVVLHPTSPTTINNETNKLPNCFKKSLSLTVLDNEGGKERKGKAKIKNALRYPERM